MNHCRSHSLTHLKGTFPSSRELIANWRCVPVQSEHVHVLTRYYQDDYRYQFDGQIVSVSLDFSLQYPKGTLKSFLKKKIYIYIGKNSAPCKIRINQCILVLNEQTISLEICFLCPPRIDSYHPQNQPAYAPGIVCPSDHLPMSTTIINKHLVLVSLFKG